MKENSISSSLIPVALDQSPRVILFFMANIVLHAEAISRAWDCLWQAGSQASDTVSLVKS